MSNGKMSWNGFIIKASMKNHKNYVSITPLSTSVFFSWQNFAIF
jgi:hypothetical protein